MAQASRRWRLFLALPSLVMAAWALPAVAVEFRSVSADAAVLFDAPSRKARKLFILARNYPLEVLVSLDGWTKVRDATGELAWIEASQLDARRMLLVKVPRAAVRQQPDEAAPVAFEVEQDVVLEMLETSGNFVRVRHADGGAGYIRITHVWGL